MRGRRKPLGARVAVVRVAVVRGQRPASGRGMRGMTMISVPATSASQRHPGLCADPGPDRRGRVLRPYVAQPAKTGGARPSPPGPAFLCFPACRVANGRAWPGRRGHPTSVTTMAPGQTFTSETTPSAGACTGRPSSSNSSPAPTRCPGATELRGRLGKAHLRVRRLQPRQRWLEPCFVSPNRTDQRPNRCWMKLAMGPLGLR